MEGRDTHYAPLYSLSLLLARLWGRASAQHRRQPLQRVVSEGQKVRLKFLYAQEDVLEMPTGVWFLLDVSGMKGYKCPLLSGEPGCQR